MGCSQGHCSLYEVAQGYSASTFWAILDNYRTGDINCLTHCHAQDSGKWLQRMRSRQCRILLSPTPWSPPWGEGCIISPPPWSLPWGESRTCLVGNQEQRHSFQQIVYLFFSSFLLKVIMQELHYTLYSTHHLLPHLTHLSPITIPLEQSLQ